MSRVSRYGADIKRMLIENGGGGREINTNPEHSVDRGEEEEVQGENPGEEGKGRRTKYVYLYALLAYMHNEDA